MLQKRAMQYSELDSSVLERLRGILARYPVALAYVYGSAAAGRATPLSDFDIALVLDEPTAKSPRRLELELRIEEEIARLCDISQADVRAINDAPLMLRGEVVTNGILLYSRDEVFRVDFETLTRSMYFDFLPTAELHRKAFFERLGAKTSDG